MCIRTYCALVFSFIFSINVASSQSNNYEVGLGIFDITGEIAESRFFGYADPLLSTRGIRDRQYARAFIMQEPSGLPVVFVCVDKGAVFQAMNVAVLDKLQAQFGNLYNDKNVIISATHTHVAAGGCSHYSLYRLSTGGFYKTNFDNVVEGIFQAIVRAHNNIAPGRIYYNKGSLTNASINRSLPAYANNVDAALFPSIDDEMTVLKFIQGNTEVGVISWFAVHPTSLNKTYTHNSGDNKGYAALAFERLKNSNYDASNSFVAAFANTNPADMSPNLNLPPAGDTSSEATGPGINAEESCDIIGTRQFNKALELYNAANIQLLGSINAVSRYSDFSQIVIDPSFTDGQIQSTCSAALGTSFAAGTEDGRSGLGFVEGEVNNPPSGCHLEKPIFLSLDDGISAPQTPKILPVSVLKIGQLGVLAGPGEFSVMSGRRIKSTFSAVPGTGITETVFAGYADAYAGYITTREEYALQQYEGASTHFGPWTLAAYRQEFHRLASTLANPNLDPWNEPEPQIPNTSGGIDATTNVLFDDIPIGRSFGDIFQNVNESYEVRDTVYLSFWGAHPNNNLKVNNTYLTVEKFDGFNWQILYTDRDPVTKLTWARDAIAYSKIFIEWRVPFDALPGVYRICHFGTSKNVFGTLTDYTAKSSTFLIENSLCSIGYQGIYQLTGVQNLNEHYQTDLIIDSDQTINSGSNTEYNAAQMILLLPDFAVEQGALFVAEIEGCPIP